MKNLTKTLLVASTIIIPAVSYAGSGHGSDKHQGSPKHEQHATKGGMCIPGKKCPMADKMGKMQGGMGSMMKDMGNMHKHMEEMHQHMDDKGMKKHMKKMKGKMDEMTEDMKEMHEHMEKMHGMMKGKDTHSDKGGDGHNHDH